MSDLKSTILAILLLAAGLVAGWQTHQLHKETAARAEVQAAFDKYRADTKAIADAKEVAEAARQAQIATAQKEAQIENARTVAQIQASADRLRSSNGQLQRLATDLSTSLAARDPGAGAPNCSATVDALAIVVGRLDDFAGRAAIAADESRAAGQLCERSYDALRP